MTIRSALTERFCLRCLCRFPAPYSRHLCDDCMDWLQGSVERGEYDAACPPWRVEEVQR